MEGGVGGGGYVLDQFFVGKWKNFFWQLEPWLLFINHAFFFFENINYKNSEFFTKVFVMQQYFKPPQVKTEGGLNLKVFSNLRRLSNGRNQQKKIIQLRVILGYSYRNNQQDRTVTQHKFKTQKIIIVIIIIIVTLLIRIRIRILHFISPFKHISSAETIEHKSLPVQLKHSVMNLQKSSMFYRRGRLGITKG
eukprot:TRINITY_DN189_c0_g4_i2.p1 TRINITY_DN189_c0_g4~~TRINITY_DN189_c0_g4_i2.p1  ORF type:complete len:205 (+),score=0.19 TRINITY_DN189_c0_g4_i2:38-616(+)